MAKSSSALLPVLFLIVVTPTVEFLTGSTSFVEIVSDPLQLVLFIIVTEPIYVLPVLLIREALVAWKKGLPTLLSLGIAYGAINEGLAAKTYFTFNPLSQSLGPFPGVGQWLGVNWPWVADITLFHMIVSMSVPIALSFLIFPESASQRFLSRRAAKAVLTLLLILLASLTILVAVLDIPLMGMHRGMLPLLLLPTAIIILFVYLGHRMPAPDQNKRLQGFFAHPLPLAIASLVFFAVIFTPILKFFTISFIPITFLYAWFYQSVSLPGVVATFYPMVLAALAIRFFVRNSLSQTQVLAIITGVLLIPILSALTLLNVPQGAPAAALIYVSSLVTAWMRIRRSGETNGGSRNRDIGSYPRS